MENIDIQVMGDDTMAVDAVISVINTSLIEAGFTNVTQVSALGEPVVTNDTESVIEMVRQSRPELLATPISIVAMTEEVAESTPEVSEEDETVVEDSDAPNAEEEPVLVY